MEVNNSCLECLYRKQVEENQDELYLSEIKKVLDFKSDTDTSPYLVYLFDQVYEKIYGHKNPKHIGFEKINQGFNDLVLSLEKSIQKRIQEAQDPFKTALFLSRVGNYIDFGAMDTVDEQQFFDLLFKLEITEHDEQTYEIFKKKCESANSLLVLADNCGEIVLDKIFLQQLHKTYPHIKPYIMVRHEEINNDATLVDARYVHLEEVATVLTNGMPIAGTVYELLPAESKKIVDQVDIILSKGMGNYESASSIGRPIFYSFLCKCDVFANRFQVPRFTGMFIYEESGQNR